MDYKDEMKTLVDRYFTEILVTYKKTAMDANADGKKLALFRKIDYSGHIQDFLKLKDEAEKLYDQVDELDVPDNDGQGKDLKEKFLASLEDFETLCERNADHYDLMDRKQYTKNKVSLDDFKLSLAGANSAMVTSVGTLNTMERAFRIFMGEEVPEEDDDLETELTDEETGQDDVSYINKYDVSDEEGSEKDTEFRQRPRSYKKQDFDEE
jgi:hypothetical protein